MDTMPPRTAPLDRMIRALDRAVGRQDPIERCADVKRALVEAAGGPRPLLPESCLASTEDGYARHLLHRDPGGAYSVVVMVWGPGQATPLHDHDGRWCVECVFDGRIRVTSYSREGAAPEGLLKFHEETSVLAGIGAAGALIPPHEYHRIENADGTAAITVHVYEGEMTRCNAYEPRADGLFARVEKPLAYT